MLISRIRVASVAAVALVVIAGVLSGCAPGESIAQRALQHAGVNDVVCHESGQPGGVKCRGNHGRVRDTWRSAGINKQGKYRMRSSTAPDFDVWQVGEPHPAVCFRYVSNLATRCGPWA